MKAAGGAIIELARDPRFVGGTFGVLAVLHYLDPVFAVSSGGNQPAHPRRYQKDAILAADRAGAWKSRRAHRTVAAKPGICRRPSTFHVSADRNRAALPIPDARV